MSKKATTVRKIKVEVDGGPKFLMGQSVFRLTGDGIIEEFVTAILLTSKGFSYYTEDYEASAGLPRTKFLSGSTLFATKEELIASL